MTSIPDIVDTTIYDIDLPDWKVKVSFLFCDSLSVSKQLISPSMSPTFARTVVEKV